MRNPSGNNTWTGAITVGSAGARIVSGTLSGTTTDSLLITTGGINTGTASSTLILDVVKGVHIRGVISGAGALTKISADTLLLSGANSYSGATTLSAGVIQLQNQDGLGSTSPQGTAPSGLSSSDALGTYRPRWLRRQWVTSRPGAGCGSQTMG